MVVDQASSSAVDAIKVSVIKLPRFSYPALKKTVTANISGKDKGEVPSMSYVVMFVAEFIGTGLLMFMGCLGGIYQFDLPTIPIHHMGGLVFGLTVMTIIQIFGHISGAHLNPAVTIASVLLGTLRPLMAVVYVLAQFSGAILGFGLLKILGPEQYITDGFCSTTVHSTITPFQALGIEIVITTVLILVCCAVWDKRNGHKEDSIPLRFGLIIAVISMGAGPLTGASMNTARSFAPLVFGGSWQHHWIYWVGPNISAFIACGIYQLLFALPNEEEIDKSKSENVYLEEVSPDSAEKV